MIYPIDKELFILRRRQEYLRKCIELSQTCDYGYNEHPDFETDDWFNSLRAEYPDVCNFGDLLEELAKLKFYRSSAQPR